MNRKIMENQGHMWVPPKSKSIKIMFNIFRYALHEMLRIEEDAQNMTKKNSKEFKAEVTMTGIAGGVKRAERRTITTAAFVSAVNFSTVTLLAGKATASLILLTVLNKMMMRRDICTHNCNKTRARVAPWLPQGCFVNTCIQSFHVN